MSASARVLVVDDDASLRRLLGIRLERAGYEVESAADGREALAQVASRCPDLVITDLRMDGMDGMALFDALHRRHPALPVIILTAHGNIPEAVEATRLGVAGYLTKPFESQALVEYVARTLATRGSDPDGTAASAEWRRGVVTRNAAMNALLDGIERVAASDSSVLLTGASGTGKELLARALHDASRRSSAEFVAVNCTAIPEQLLESELFGHARGAFTGATRDHDGLLKAADGGTLFLDEIGDMPLAFQAKLLRALQEREVRPVGSTRAHPVDVRVVSATHRDLGAMVAEQAFREDLYYRINVVTLEVPRLAERPEDVPLLATHFLGVLREQGHSATGFSTEAMEALVGAPWPGNVRHLRNVVEHCVVLATTPLIPVDLVRKALRSEPLDMLPFAEARDRFELDYLVRLLQITEGNVSQAARIAGRNRSEFYKLLRRHHLQPEMFRAQGDAPPPRGG